MGDTDSVVSQQLIRFFITSCDLKKSNGVYLICVNIVSTWTNRPHHIIRAASMTLSPLALPGVTWLGTADDA